MSGLTPFAPSDPSSTSTSRSRVVPAAALALLSILSLPARAQLPYRYSFGSGTLVDPADVAVYDTCGKPKFVYVADWGLHRVVSYSGAGQTGSTPVVWGFAGFVDGPTGIAVNDIPGHCNEGQVYVTDYDASDDTGFLLVFSSNGLLLKQVAWNDGGSNGFQNPWGVAVDRNGDVYVADRLPSFGRTARFAAANFGPPYFLSVLAPADQVFSTSPWGQVHDVSVDLGGRVHVVNGCGCFTVYEPDGTLLEVPGPAVPNFGPSSEAVDALDIKGRSWVSQSSGIVRRHDWDWTNYSTAAPTLDVATGYTSNPRGLETVSYAQWWPGSEVFKRATLCQKRLFVCDRGGAEVDVFGQDTTSTPLPPNAVAWWRFEERYPQCFGGTSPPVSDVFGNEGTVVSGTTPVSTQGVVRCAFSTNSGQGRVAVPSSPSLAFGGGSFTVEGWMMTRKTTGTQSFLDKRAGIGKGWLLFTYNGHLGLQINLGGGTSANYTPQVPENFVADGTWRCFAIVYTPTSVTFYVDGVAVPGAITPLVGNVDTTTPLTIGAGNPTSGDNPFSGFLDELTIYNRALTPAEVGAICAAGCAGKEIPLVRELLRRM